MNPLDSLDRQVKLEAIQPRQYPHHVSTPQWSIFTWQLRSTRPCSRWLELHRYGGPTHLAWYLGAAFTFEDLPLKAMRLLFSGFFLRIPGNILAFFGEIRRFYRKVGDFTENSGNIPRFRCFNRVSTHSSHLYLGSYCGTLLR